MQKFTINFYASIAILAVGIVAMLALGFQQVQAVFQKGILSGESIRVSAANACTAEEADMPHFSGCNSIL